MPKDKKINIKSDGGPVFMGNVDNRKGYITGRADYNNQELDGSNVSKLFENLYILVDTHTQLSKTDKSDIKVEIKEIRQELTKKNKADEDFIMRRLRNIRRMAPDILEVIIATIANPVAGFGMVASKIAQKIKAEAT